MSFEGKVVLITGASSGIGAAAAIHLAKLGASIALVGRDRAKLNSVTQQIIESGGPKPFEIALDVTTHAHCIIDETIITFGKLDVLINNAGVMSSGTIETSSLDEYDRIMNTNVRSVIALTQLAVPHLIASKGNIINISSMLGVRPCQGVLSYSISKAAINHFTKCVSMELASKGVRVNAVNPGVTNTPLIGSVAGSDNAALKYMENTKSSYPLGRVGTVDDMAAAIEFLASDKASFITGHLLLVDGGKNNVCPR